MLQCANSVNMEFWSATTYKLVFLQLLLFSRSHFFLFFFFLFFLFLLFFSYRCRQGIQQPSNLGNRAPNLNQACWPSLHRRQIQTKVKYWSFLPPTQLYPLRVSLVILAPVNGLHGHPLAPPTSWPSNVVMDEYLRNTVRVPGMI
jgi:hypothetical protein